MADRRSTSNLATSGRGFSLIELLVVIVIIVIVVSLLLPAIGGARDIAKAATTRSVIKEFGNAVDRFRQDNSGFRPGVFSEQEMGNSENADVYGFTAQENMMLELAGGIVFDEGGGGPQLKTFGPTQLAHQENDDSGRFVREDLIGADVEGNPGYFQPDSKFFAAQSRPEGQFADSAGLSQGEANIPDFLDAWGNPLVVWVRDGQAPPVVDQEEQFAREDSDSDPALFYWASNAGYLKATELGRSSKDQNRNNSEPYSLIGGNAQNIETSITGLLGNSSSPLQELDGGVALDALLPASARGEIVVHSAGTNGLFLGTKERASKSYDAEANGLRYGLTYFTSGSNRRLSSSGSMETQELTEGFDDIILTFGN